MNIDQILAPICARSSTDGGSKKRTLELIAKLLADYDPAINPGELFEALINRERMGSTGFGKGIAIPHCRLKSCASPVAVVLTLAEPIDFDAIDKEPVDLIFALVVPEQATETHLNILKNLASRLDQASYCQSLRSALDDKTLYLRAIASPEQE